jgi:AAA domain, putative AbiEii toxin, Type IV TA system/AAA ATPase domain
VLKNLTLRGFRTFRELHVDRLKRVNLFVGTNNAGKTSVLEAIEILSRGTARALLESLERRNERLADVPGTEWDISHLFHGHSSRVGSSFHIEGQAKTKAWVHCEILEGGLDTVEPQLRLASEIGEPFTILRFGSHLEERALEVSPAGGISEIYRRRTSLMAEGSLPVLFLGTDSAKTYDLRRLWDAIVLTHEEDKAATALRIIEPRIERIAFLVEPQPSGGVFLKLNDSEQRLPLGSTGDGLKRLLALALHLLSARGGYILIDEIDTGLHYSVMENMWKLVIETARRIDAQVLATTHSLDCVKALAWVKEANPHFSEEVALHRFEKDLPHTVEYSLDELAIAARHHVEVR